MSWIGYIFIWSLPILNLSLFLLSGERDRLKLRFQLDFFLSFSSFSNVVSQHVTCQTWLTHPNNPRSRFTLTWSFGASSSSSWVKPQFGKCHQIISHETVSTHQLASTGWESIFSYPLKTHFLSLCLPKSHDPRSMWFDTTGQVLLDSIVSTTTKVKAHTHGIGFSGGLGNFSSIFVRIMSELS